MPAHVMQSASETGFVLPHSMGGTQKPSSAINRLSLPVYIPLAKSLDVSSPSVHRKRTQSVIPGPQDANESVASEPDTLYSSCSSSEIEEDDTSSDFEMEEVQVKTETKTGCAVQKRCKQVKEERDAPCTAPSRDKSNPKEETKDEECNDVFGELIDYEAPSFGSESDSVAWFESDADSDAIQFSKTATHESEGVQSAVKRMDPRRRSGLFAALQLGEADGQGAHGGRLSRALGTKSAPELGARATSRSFIEHGMQCTDPGEFRVCRHCRSLFPFIRSSERESLRHSFCSGECHLTYVTLYHLAAKRRSGASGTQHRYHNNKQHQ